MKFKLRDLLKNYSLYLGDLVEPLTAKTLCANDHKLTLCCETCGSNPSISNTVSLSAHQTDSLIHNIITSGLLF